MERIPVGLNQLRCLPPPRPSAGPPPHMGEESKGAADVFLPHVWGRCRAQRGGGGRGAYTRTESAQKADAPRPDVPRACRAECASGVATPGPAWTTENRSANRRYNPVGKHYIRTGRMLVRRAPLADHTFHDAGMTGSIPVAPTAKTRQNNPPAWMCRRPRFCLPFIGNCLYRKFPI